MPSEHQEDDAIIRAAYAERIREAFRVFAENLAMGENERGSRERFVRSIEQMRKARDLALDAVAGNPAAEVAPASQPGPQAAAGDGLSDEERAMIEQALSGTTGQRAPTPLPGATARSPLMRR